MQLCPGLVSVISRGQKGGESKKEIQSLGDPKELLPFSPSCPHRCLGEGRDIQRS